MKSNTLHHTSIHHIDLVKVTDHSQEWITDYISVEEPLEIRIRTTVDGIAAHKNISVTMRTPGNDAELASGFLFTEGLISKASQIKSVDHVDALCTRNGHNIIVVELSDGFAPETTALDRNFYTTSSCGVCGKGSIAAIKTISIFRELFPEYCVLRRDMLCALPDRLRAAQSNFSATGGIHAAGLFDLDGQLNVLREDVGRHNALDKLIGYALMADLLPLQRQLLLLSGRASFELVQKAAMAGISIIAAIGAPSSLAIELAKESDMTLLGFLRDHRFNIYHLGNNIEIEGLIV
ncbi:formate dehydrogenase accessory sulfurtransferase FdhD [Sphingobacterium sp. GVS05A]|uniref:formate dehydrogenase accessory sulfurtransferase FdhD n=1 Tax=Sphingobacterium TaxID=28453 RepID=UPI001CBEF984|nr:formate dehydrogenase accessory sulfurtransferase FdhD [Sphingobacterium sp. GVS05A]